MSHDDGATWADTPVTTSGGKGTLTLTHPSKAPSVSFRTTLTDTDGNTYEATILKAYLLT